MHGPSRLTGACLATALVLVLAVVASRPARASDAVAAPVDYARQIRPILARHCYNCHGPDERRRKAGLRLDVREAAVKTLASGEPAIVPGVPEAGALIARVFSEDDLEVMPPPGEKARLDESQKRLLRDWVAAGAPYARHWAFEPPRRPAPPATSDSTWSRNAIDRFILAKLEEAGLSPSAEADRTTLIRRLSFDLRGLPPSLEEVDAFLEDGAPDAYERLVERMLASHHYGEKRAMHWLDLVRYADTAGYMPDWEWTLWPYRDWVIRAFNRNMPFDRFTTEQLAGDLLPDATTDQRVATGLLRCIPYNAEGGVDPKEFSVQMAVDRTNTVATAWLGLTLGCAQCHDHKYDPITQREYYQLYAFLNSIKGENGGGTYSPVPLVLPPMLELMTPFQTRELKRAVAQRERIEAAVRGHLERIEYRDPEGVADAADRSLSAWLGRVAGGKVEGLPASIVAAAKKPADARTAEERKALRDHFVRHVWHESRDVFDPLDRELEALRQLEARVRGSLPVTMVMAAPDEPVPAFVLARGDFQRPGERVGPGVPDSLSTWPEEAPRDRRGLAAWLTDPRHPLMARVAVNRFWAQVFGTGIVATADDFGTQGAPPSHPELLDWLAVELVESGWDVKALFRTIVRSATYRQSSIPSERARGLDPGDRLLSHFPRRRLVAEEIRDNALAIAGLLDRTIGGPSVKPYQPEHYYTSKTNRWTWEHDRGPRLYRRGLYTFWRRTTLYPSFLIMDAPGRETCTVVRPRTNTPLQSLVMLNDPAFVEAARVLAQRVLLETLGDEDRLNLAFRRVVVRPPSPEEQDVLRVTLRQQRDHYRGHPEAARLLVGVGDFPRPGHLEVVEHAAWTAVANVLLNLDETITKE